MIGAPADHCRGLGRVDLALHNGVNFTLCGRTQANKEFKDDVQEEEHGDVPTVTIMRAAASESFITNKISTNSNGTVRSQSM